MVIGLVAVPLSRAVSLGLGDAVRGPRAGGSPPAYRELRPVLLAGAGRLTDSFYPSHEGKPTGTLRIIAFQPAKIAKPMAAMPPATAADDGAAPKARAAEVPEARAAALNAMPTQASTTPSVVQAPIFDWQTERTDFSDGHLWVTVFVQTTRDRAVEVSRRAM